MKELIQSSLQNFAAGDVADNARNLFQTLGYNTTRQAPFDEKTFGWFRENYFQPDTNFNAAKALADKWNYVDLLFQLSAEELQSHLLAFDTRQVDETRIESYLFFAIGLPGREYTRTALADITRELNKVFPMPCFVLFAYDDKLTLAVVNRRLHRRDESRDVLLKVTLIKDINIAQPKRSHIEILHDLALPELQRKHRFTNFVELHEAWQKTLDTKELNKRFFQELANWYFWAVQNVTFPDGVEPNAEVRHATAVIRLITRLIFVWFVREKGLVSEALFNRRKLNDILRWQDESAFYKAILQNLFFATLNSNMGERKFIAPGYHGRNAQHFVHNVLRYESEFINPDTALQELFAPIPFLNGGLFECLDKEENGQRIRVDGFSDHPANVLRVPDELFFGAEREVDLSTVYGDKKKAKAKVRGLLNILDNYKFTIAENTPLEEEIALDPELLGKVFENLLANYNPETKTTARKQTGSFYTPREIVNYMVDESLIAYLKAKLQTETFGFQAINTRQPDFFGNAGRKQLAFEEALNGNRWQGKDEALEQELRRLFAYTETEHDFNDTETEILVKAIDECKILDPACGSGAFPMGVLHRLVFLLGKLDPRNQKWRAWQKLKAIEETKAAYDIGDHHERETRLREINDIFDLNASDYGRKLFLIENCIYGVDIQPIAIQIAKLRFFISLIVDQKADPAHTNLGVRPLPNLETKFVAANTLIGLEHLGLKPNGMDELEQQLKDVRAQHFSARTRKTKEKYRAEDERLRIAIAELLKLGGINPTSADLVAGWNPYDQNASAPWFDAEWMFGLESGFDIVLGNPPYFAVSLLEKKMQDYLSESNHRTYKKGADVYCLFYEKSFDVLKSNAVICLITSNRFCFTNYGVDLRGFLAEKNILQIINFNEVDVFESANVGSLITLIEKRKPTTQPVRALEFRETESSSLYDLVKGKAKLLSKDFFKENQWSFGQDKAQALKRKLESNGTPFIKWEKCSTNRGITTGLNEVFIISASKRDEIIARDPKSTEILRPVLKGANIKRYLTIPATNYLIYTYTGINIENYPGVFDYLIQHKKKLQEVYEAKHGQKKWYELRKCSYYDKFFKRKLIWTRLSNQNAFTISEDGEFTIDSSSFAVSRDANYLCGVLNSKAVFFYFKLGSVIWGKDGIKWFGKYFDNIPIPKATDAQQAEIAALVEEILAAKRADARADTSEAERRIDELVYALYGLDAAEIAIIEGR